MSHYSSLFGNNVSDNNFLSEKQADWSSDWFHILAYCVCYVWLCWISLEAKLGFRVWVLLINENWWFPAVSSRWGITSGGSWAPRAAECLVTSLPVIHSFSSWSWMLDLGEAPVLVLISGACWHPSPGNPAPAQVPVSASVSAPALVPSPCRRVTGKLASGIWLW